MTGLPILKLGKLQHLLSGPSPGPLRIPTAGRPQRWPGGQGFCVCVCKCLWNELAPWKASQVRVVHFPFLLLYFPK